MNTLAATNSTPAATKVDPIPNGMHTVTPHLICAEAADAIRFYQQAFGAEELWRLAVPGSDKIMHAQIRIGDSTIMLVDEMPEWGCKGPTALGGTPVTIHLQVEDADALFARAVAAGATVKMPVAEMFWGDRYGIVIDPCGHCWSIATHVRDLTPDEIAKGAADMHCPGNEA